MPLTNAQKQAAYAARRKIKLQRLAAYEAALREIAEMQDIALGGDADGMQMIARQALTLTPHEIHLQPRTGA